MSIASEPKFKHAASAKLFPDYRDQQCLIFFRMDPTDDFKHVHTSLFHCSPLPTLDQAVTKFLSEETNLSLWKIASFDNVFATFKGPFLDAVLATSHSKGHHQSGFNQPWCNCCKKFGQIS